ncbi:hypothetical protein SDC9_150266 [bioreactor metagenome]|uniref:Uncharacterized protein n=1 Tax=bioreactor metagenome TaxID=1076179 RepID=A0A645ER88_9ZZZZ
MNAIAFHFGNRAFRLQERMVGKRHAVMIGDHVRAVFNRLVRIATLDELIGKQVVRTIQMDELKAFLARIVGGENRGERFILDLDCKLAGFERFRCFRNDQRDCIA